MSATVVISRRALGDGGCEVLGARSAWQEDWMHFLDLGESFVAQSAADLKKSAADRLGQFRAEHRVYEKGSRVNKLR